jgi:uncharacterized membrane protein YjdF
VPAYRIAPLFLLPLLWAPYWVRQRLELRPLHYALFAVAVCLHDLGAYGYYQKWPLPFSFDIAVHSYFAFAVTFPLHSSLSRHLAVRPRAVSAATLMLIMGAGAMHEIMEYLSYLFLGEEWGMLKTTSYHFDTQRDLLSNLMGTLAALSIVWGVGRLAHGRGAALADDLRSRAERRPDG